MAGDSRLTTENFLRLNFTPKAGITPTTEDTLCMDCDQIVARYKVSVSGVTSTGKRLPSQNELASALNPPVFNELSFPDGRTRSVIPVRTNFSSSLTVTERGIWYNTTGATPTGTKLIIASSTGQIDTNVTGLSEGTTYYFSAYCINADGTTTYSFGFGIATPSSRTFTGGTGSYTVPSGVTSMTVECFGSGGSGGAATGNAGSRAGGGSGGSYAKAVVSVTPGWVCPVYSGVVASATVSTGVNGEASYLRNPSLTDLCKAVGGIAGATASGTSSAGGVATSTGCVGTTIYKGGDGGAGTIGGFSGGGGGAGASWKNGSSGNLSTGGSGAADYSGAGASGVSTDGAVNAGGNYGGGGSGGLATGTTDRKGGDGAMGFIIITFP